MFVRDCETMWMCQLNKPAVRAKIEEFVARHLKGGKEFAKYYKFIVDTLKATPAWGVSGVNDFVSELTTIARNYLYGTKGKTSAFAHAKKTLRRMDDPVNGVNSFAKSSRGYGCALKVLAESELKELENN